jgi:hypothetical protein
VESWTRTHHGCKNQKPWTRTIAEGSWIAHFDSSTSLLERTVEQRRDRATKRVHKDGRSWSWGSLALINRTAGGKGTLRRASSWGCRCQHGDLNQVNQIQRNAYRLSREARR